MLKFKLLDTGKTHQVFGNYLIDVVFSYDPYMNRVSITWKIKNYNYIFSNKNLKECMDLNC
jgi:hypothetical protein